MIVEGFVKIGTRTKELVKYLSSEDIAVIQHDDIDELAAEALINSRIKAVINTGKSMTGKYLSRGTAMLVNSNIKLFDTSLAIQSFKDSEFIRIKGKDIIINNIYLHSNACSCIGNEYIKQKSYESIYCYTDQLSAFIDNTLEYSTKEKDSILNFNSYPEISTNLNGRVAIVVVRSAESREGLLSLMDYIERTKPVLIGVDGGADILLSCGLLPDILIGDMDSVSDVGIYRSREIILHSYVNGSCPCLDRISTMNIKYKLLPMPGTSEDVALLLAYDKGASSIILIGGHNCMTDFVERGRKGMGSTLITRMKVEDRLIDYKHMRRFQLINDRVAMHTDYMTEGDLQWMKM